MQKKTDGNNKKLVLEAFDSLFNKRDYLASYNVKVQINISQA